MEKIKLDGGNITLIRGDCLEIMPKMRVGIIDMVLCDLPYGTTDCKWDTIIPFDLLWREYKRLGKSNIAYVLTSREPFTSLLVTSNIQGYKHKWVWNKKQSGSFQNAKYMPLQIEEDVLVFSEDDIDLGNDVVVFADGKVKYYPKMRKGKARIKGGAKTKNDLAAGIKPNHSTYNDLYYPVNIIELVNPRIGKLHPTEKPVELMEYLIETYTNPGDLVLDNTMGSGTTAVACINTNRRFVGIEKDTDDKGNSLGYFDTCIRRCEEALALRNQQKAA